MLPQRLILIGYRGTGKTSVGQQLATALQYECIDSDVEIERIAGMSIGQIFEQETEAGFRRRETEVIRDLASREQVVLALGGGAILRAENRQAIATPGSLTIWLRATAETLYQRIQADQNNAARRPALTTAGPREEIVQLLSEREPLYRQCADWEIDTEGKPLPAVALEILERLASGPAGGHPSDDPVAPGGR